MKKNKEVKGINVTTGIAIGPAFLFLAHNLTIPKFSISKEEIPSENLEKLKNIIFQRKRV